MCDEEHWLYVWSDGWKWKAQHKERFFSTLWPSFQYVIINKLLFLPLLGVDCCLINYTQNLT